MCGITGFCSVDHKVGTDDLVREMTACLAHRGPDAEGFWTSTCGHAAFGHRRLAIQDLSSAGAQPMVSVSRRFAVSYNGEIYNHQDIRQAIGNDGHDVHWVGSSDTETLVAAIELFGLERTLAMLDGMFAFALWDAEDKALYLARDRMGEKPLYYSTGTNGIVFGSELKALIRHPDVVTTLNPTALQAFFAHASVPSPLCIYQGVRQLPPAHLVKWSLAGNKQPEPQCYWDLPVIATSGVANSTKAGDTADDKAVLDSLEASLSHSVSSRMLADVPLGAFLSGGIDSSLIVSLMAASSSQPVKTFTVGFSESDYDESVAAAAVARHLGTDHTEMIVSADDALALIPSIADIWDEPFADPSQLPTFLISKLTREHVTVSMSGDGGDELFFGYSRYQQALELWQKLQRYPQVARVIAGKLAAKLSLPLCTILDSVSSGKPESLHRAMIGVSSISGAFNCQSFESFYWWLTTLVREEMVAAAESPYAHGLLLDGPGFASNGQQNVMMLADMQGYLPNTILTKVDRASMAASLESRAPFLDHALVEKVWSMPLTYKFRDGQSKWALKKILGRHVPEALYDRPKQGFGVPVGRWLQGPLNEWAGELLEPARLRRQGILNEEVVSRLWRQHQKGQCDWQYQLWPVVILQAWLERYGHG